ncbi:UNKNOWN [Stylonychia lemnae]|uniref:Uncharacterized protein n=1 Tax=Stylonychia lemnae TaxID=5949 RepID=A0A078BBS3_STYLE|nr:UNKNOWN [Stylonychia lemnae]|eukprot:CDW90707.1 UNKNOWN [Stylonychia lemnae]
MGATVCKSKQSIAITQNTKIIGTAGQVKINDDDCIEAVCVKVEEITNNMKMIKFRCLQNLEFLAGQYICFYNERPSATSDNPPVFPAVFSICSPPYELPFIDFLIEENHNPRSMKNLLFFQAKEEMKVYLGKKGYGTVAIDINMLQTPLPWNGGSGGITLIGGGSAVQAC